MKTLDMFLFMFEETIAVGKRTGHDMKQRELLASLNTWLSVGVRTPYKFCQLYLSFLLSSLFSPLTVQVTKEQAFIGFIYIFKKKTFKKRMYVYLSFI